MLPATLPIVRDIGFVSRLTWVTAGLLLVSSISGLAFGTRGLYAPDETLWSFVGQDAVTLVFALPLLLVSANLALRGSTRALLTWVGVLFYIAYAFYFYVVGARFNILFPVYITLVSMGMYGSLALLFSIDMEQVRSHFSGETRVRTIAGFLMAVASLFVALWLTLTIVSLMTGSKLDNISRFVIAVDGVVLLPLTFFGGLWLWRRQPLGYVLAGLLLVKVTATTLTLVVNTLLVTRSGLPLDTFQLTLYAIVMSFSAILLISYLRCADAPGAAT